MVPAPRLLQWATRCRLLLTARCCCRCCLLLLAAAGVLICEGALQDTAREHCKTLIVAARSPMTRCDRPPRPSHQASHGRSTPAGSARFPYRRRTRARSLPSSGRAAPPAMRRCVQMRQYCVCGAAGPSQGGSLRRRPCPRGVLLPSDLQTRHMPVESCCPPPSRRCTRVVDRVVDRSPMTCRRPRTDRSPILLTSMCCFRRPGRRAPQAVAAIEQCLGVLERDGAVILAHVSVRGNVQRQCSAAVLNTCSSAQLQQVVPTFRSAPPPPPKSWRPSLRVSMLCACRRLRRRQWTPSSGRSR